MPGTLPALRLRGGFTAADVLSGAFRTSPSNVWSKPQDRQTPEALPAEVNAAPHQPFACSFGRGQAVNLPPRPGVVVVQGGHVW
jgi:hypothetical protein